MFLTNRFYLDKCFLIVVKVVSLLVMGLFALMIVTLFSGLSNFTSLPELSPIAETKLHPPAYQSSAISKQLWQGTLKNRQWRVLKQADKTYLLRQWTGNKARNIWQTALPEQLSVVDIKELSEANLLFVLGKRQAQSIMLIMHAITGDILNQYQLSQQAWQGLMVNNQILWLYQAQGAISYQLNQTTASLSLSEVFQPQQHDGWSAPANVWQSQSADVTNYRKLNVWPMVKGSIKLALGAVLIALPIALGAAFYLGFYASVTTRNRIKPVIEILEVIPSVLIAIFVLNFIDRASIIYIVTMLIVLFSMPLAAYLLSCLQAKSNQIVSFSRVSTLRKSLFLGLYILVVFGVVYLLAPVTNYFAVTQELQQNILILFALGLAIVPSVFTLAEESIANIPKTYVKAAYALGASSSQVLTHVALKLALPSLMAAVMLGLGRAFGETMIVHMISGNAPVDSWSLFNDLRSLASNLFIEMPEAKQGSAHMSVLYLSALLLFAFSFTLNSIVYWLVKRGQNYVH